MQGHLCAYWSKEKLGQDRCFAEERCFRAHPGGVSRGNAMVDGQAVPAPELCWTGLKTRQCEFGEQCVRAMILA